MDAPALDPAAVRRNRRLRWEAKGMARVIHPDYGMVVVPCASPFAALKCAAEVWRCNWTTISEGATVLASMEGDVMTQPPFRIYRT